MVTGAGRGLGRGVALALAADGARVWVCDRTTEELDETAAAIEQAGGQVQILRFDLAEIAACHEAITESKPRQYTFRY